MEKFLKQEKSH